MGRDTRALSLRVEGLSLRAPGMRVGGVGGGGWDLGLLGINVELGVAIELKRFIQKLHL